jgi:glycerol-3-phosphate dehydrogenase
LLPAYRGAAGQAALKAALLINDLVSHRRNQGLEPGCYLPPGRLVSRTECLRLFPWFTSSGLTGGALWYDGRLRHPERLTLSFVRSAAERGAVAVNYLKVDRVLVRDGRACGARVTDVNQGTQFDLSARAVAVAAGPWTTGLLADTLGRHDPGPAAGHTLAVNIRVDRPLLTVAVGVRSLSGPEEDPVGGGGRYLFAAPQTGSTLLGTWYGKAEGQVTPEQGMVGLVREFNRACPGLELSLGEVVGIQSGWLPLKGSAERGRPTALAERPRLVNHGQRDGVRHLFSVPAVQYTTARSVAQRVVDWVFQALETDSPACRTTEVPLEQAGTDGVPTRSDIQRAVRQEMAVKLTDIIFRRSSLGTSGRLDRAVVSEIAAIASGELGWNTMRQEAEVEEVMRQQANPLPVVEPVG